MLERVSGLKFDDVAVLYAGFQAPLSALDCGDKCAPYNQGVPVCCDTRHAVPTAYSGEWAYLQANTDLWHRWEADEAEETARLQQEAPSLALIECKGHTHCQRDYRTVVCRAFPFFPYLDSRGACLGLSYYWEYEDRCWMLSNLYRVSGAYRDAFTVTYARLFAHMPDERETFAQHSAAMRQTFAQARRAIPVLHRNGGTYKISPRSERMRRVQPDSLPKFGPFKIADVLLFPDEM